MKQGERERKGDTEREKKKERRKEGRKEREGEKKRKKRENLREIVGWMTDHVIFKYLLIIWYNEETTASDLNQKLKKMYLCRTTCWTG